MSLLKSGAYRPYAQLDGSCDDDKNLLTHQHHQKHHREGHTRHRPHQEGLFSHSSSTQSFDESSPITATTAENSPNKWTKWTLFTLASLLLLSLAAAGVLVLGVHGSAYFVHGTSDTDSSSSWSNTAPKQSASRGSPFEEVVVVDTECAKLSGLVEDGAFAFKGIPYAVPPKGNLRWSRPVPLASEPRLCQKSRHQNANKFGSPCFQVNPYTKQFEGSEDCLYLNVWTPRLDDSANLEVMVWIHGGFLQFGHGHQPGLRPSGKLAKKLDTVFVSFNYRLHALGFLALDQLANSGANSSFGNYGLWDQTIALKWVQENIKEFGGDPRKVTVFGPDGGSAAILALASNTDNEHLFRSAWLLGPALFFNHTFDELSHRNHNLFLQRSGCDTAQCLRSLSPRSVVQLFLGKDDPSFRINDQNDLPIQGIYPEQLVVVDGELVGQPVPFDVDIPLLIGTAAQAVEYWPGPNDLRSWTWSQYVKYVTTSLDSFGPRLSQMALEKYPAASDEVDEKDEYMAVKLSGARNESDLASSNSSSGGRIKLDQMKPELLYASMVSDVRQTCPVNKIARHISNSSASEVYRYIVTAHPSQPVHIYDYESMYAFHLWDAIAFFGEIESFIRRPTSEDYEFQGQMQRIAMDFVKGHQSKERPMWRQFPDEVALVDSNVTLVDTYASERCDFWEREGLEPYVWVS